ncbi:uncharacterized protein AFUA_8G00810 [Aspergillus fumigatus Af293]|jgi:hypothetical protein|uniref:Uncharacterized protein n=2 Tax=Aspergillus fumigatus TaxID=746128 RepID=Q4WB26_ASPFU|nr:hypothetical protein AFUA_8G00810 [Aspergillus fumigatus Af293]EAL85086.1 hypothetical protein AFUA_8G00810 [Aspergillus fumigatus Af293]EDP49127.1 hypothetical protein AFUB_085760 [Aspergillus fumigatus A1163]
MHAEWQTGEGYLSSLDDNQHASTVRPKGLSQAKPFSHFIGRHGIGLYCGGGVCERESL